MVVYYNTDVFEANGWEKPETLDELIAVCSDAQAKGLIPFSFGNSDYQGAVDWLYSTFLSCYAGPDAMKEALEGKRSWTDPEVRGGIDEMVDWWQKGYIGDKKSQALTGDDMVSLFASGKAAMMIDGTWASNSLITTYPDCNWDVEVMPEIHDGTGRILPLATGGCFAINKSCKDPEKNIFCCHQPLTVGNHLTENNQNIITEKQHPTHTGRLKKKHNFSVHIRTHVY